MKERRFSMCDECYFTYCPESCPNYESELGEPLGRCEKCDAYIYEGEEHVACDGKLYCVDCVEKFDTDSILLICHIGDVFELLRELGVETVGADA